MEEKDKNRSENAEGGADIQKSESSSERSDGRIDGAGVKVRMPVSRWLENFWYHYKWHTLAVLFVLAVVTVILVQCASREKYDVHILYAGDKAISTSKSTPERQQFLSAFRSVSSDFDENGEVNVSFRHLYAPDAEELAKLAELEKTGEGEIPESLIMEDKQSLESLLAQSDYYLLFLDKAVFDSSCETGVISSILTHLPEGFDGEIVEGANGASGIYLRDTGFYKLEGINTLPEDTVICIKLASVFSTDKDLEKQADAIEVFKRIALS